MLKIFTTILIVSITISSFGRVNKRLLKKIESCEMVLENGAVAAGEVFTVFLKLQLKNGEIIYSNLKDGIGFDYFKIDIQGADQTLAESDIERKGITLTLGDTPIYNPKKTRESIQKNRQLDLVTRHNLIDRPFVHVRAELIDRPEIACEINVPVHFNSHYQFEFNGDHGKFGTKGRKGSHGRNIRSRTRPTTAVIEAKNCDCDGAPGISGLNGVKGEDGSHGRDGIDTDVFISLVKVPGDYKELIKIEISPYSGETIIRYADQAGSVAIYAIGGNGGNGGRGGNGGDGGPGEYGCARLFPGTGAVVKGSGSRGGDGGNGGNGGYGGNAGYGGDGGDVNIFIEKDALFFKDNIVVYNHGGLSGRPGANGFGGRAGVGGDGGKGRGENGHAGKNGLAGFYGANGNPGEVNYYVWN